MNYLLTFLEGVVTFVSPCLLPMLPVYLAYFAGGAAGASGSTSGDGAGGGTSGGDAGGGTDAGDTSAGRASGGLRHTVLCALGFVLGFGVVFTLLGAFAGTLGSFLVRYQRAVCVACGLVMVTLGLNYAGVLRIPALERTLRPGVRVAPRGFASSVLFGVVFAVGWSPCVGTFLASALSLAASSANTVEGVLLLACFSLGLGLPFVLSAVLINQLEGAFSWIKQHYDTVNRVCGVLLVVMGVLMATGLLGAWVSLVA